MQYTYLHNVPCFRFCGGLLDCSVKDRRRRRKLNAWNYRRREREEAVGGMEKLNVHKKRGRL
jgi:hypothetical protein